MVPIGFGTYNIRNGQKGGLEAALRGMSQANMDLGILQETKLTDGVYTCGLASYNVIATNAPSRHRGGVALFYRSTPPFSSGDGGEVWAQRDGISSGGRGAKVVHRRGIRRP